MPLAAYGGRRDVMAKVAPSGPVYQAGTLSGNPVAVSCGLKTLELISRPGFFEQLSRRTLDLVQGLKHCAQKHDIPFVADSEGGMFGFFFNSRPVKNFADAKTSDVVRFKKFFWGMMENGVYMAPSAFEAGFVSGAHTEKDISLTLEIADKVMKGCR